MKTKVRRVGIGYGVLLPKQVIKRLGLKEGSVLAITETEGGALLSPVDPDFSDQLEAFRRTEAWHRNSYQQLGR